MARRPTAVFPEQRLRFGLDRAGCLLVVEPERALPRPRSEGGWPRGEGQEAPWAQVLGSLGL